MSLPNLPTATIVGAWRAQDAVYNGSNEIIEVPSLAGGPTATLIPRWFDTGSSTLHQETNEYCVFNPTGIEGNPAVVSQGNAGLYTQDAAILAAATGTNLSEFGIRGVWSAPDGYNLALGWEHWTENQCMYFENGGYFWMQLDRGSGRRGGGTITTPTPVPPETFIFTVDPSNDTLGYFGSDTSTPEGSISFDTPQASWSAFALGPLQRTAGDALPPGIWHYTQSFSWTRAIVIATPSGFLNPADTAKVVAWLNGTDFSDTRSPMLFWMCP